MGGPGNPNMTNPQLSVVTTVWGMSSSVQSGPHLSYPGGQSSQQGGHQGQMGPGQGGMGQGMSNGPGGGGGGVPPGYSSMNSMSSMSSMSSMKPGPYQHQGNPNMSSYPQR